VDTISRLLKITGLFGKWALQKRLYSAKKTFSFKKPTKRSHPICVTGLLHTCNITQLYVSRGSFVYVTWLIHVYHMTHLYVPHDSFICMAWLMYMYTTHSYVWCDSFKCAAWLIHITQWVMWQVSTIHLDMWHDSSIHLPWFVTQPIADKVAQNLEIIPIFFSSNQNSAHGIHN